MTPDWGIKVGIKVTPDWFVNYLTISSDESVSDGEALRFAQGDGTSLTMTILKENITRACGYVDNAASVIQVTAD